MKIPQLSLGKDWSLNLNNYTEKGFRAGIWASSGGGKSYALGVLGEEFMEHNIPLIAIDPEGEMWTFRERYPIAVLGGAHADLPLPTTRTEVDTILKSLVDGAAGLVFDLSDHVTATEQQEAALPILLEIFAMQTRRRRPLALLIEEFHIFAPQRGKSPCKNILARIAKQGRKRGILEVVASQRTQAADKEAISQLNVQIIGGMDMKLDYKQVADFCPGWSFHDVRMLQTGEFIIPWMAEHGEKRRFRERLCTHGGETPGFGERVEIEAEATDDRLREALAGLQEQMAKAKEKQRQEQSQIKTLEEENERLAQKVKELEQEIEQYQIALKVAEHTNAQPTDDELPVQQQMLDHLDVEAELVNVNRKMLAKEKRLGEPEEQSKTATDPSLEALKDMAEKAGTLPSYVEDCVTLLKQLKSVTVDDVAQAKGADSASTKQRIRNAFDLLERRAWVEKGTDGYSLTHTAPVNSERELDRDQKIKGDPYSHPAVKKRVTKITRDAPLVSYAQDCWSLLQTMDLVSVTDVMLAKGVTSESSRHRIATTLDLFVEHEMAAVNDAGYYYLDDENIERMISLNEALQR